MGEIKRRITDKVKEGSEVGKEAVETGKKLEQDGSEIKSLSDSIDTSMDGDDVAAKDQAESGYSSDFKATFQAEVDTREGKMEGLEGEAADSASEERGKVEDAEGRFQEMASVTDVGRSNAETAAETMRRSATEYEGFVTEATKIVEETKSEVDSSRSAIEGTFDK